MKNALWFSRHEPTEEQVKEILEVHHHTRLLRCDLGSKNLETEADIKHLMKSLGDLILENEVCSVFGVFPTPVLWFVGVTNHRIGWPVNFYAAWNVLRTQEGGKPTFEHKEFMIVQWWRESGYLHEESAVCIE